MSKQNTVDWQSNPIARIIKKIRSYFKYPNNPLTTETNWYHILRWRLNWLNPFYPNYKGARWMFFKYFFKVYLSPKPRKLKEDGELNAE